MNFVGKVLNGVEGTQYFYILGLLIFIMLFAIIIYRTVKMPKRDLIDFKTSILSDDNQDSITNK